MSTRGGRPQSGPWGRLRPMSLDPLESLGLPSKGDNRLLDFKTQERYYTSIVDRYMSFCSKAGRGDELLRQFSSLKLSEDGSGGSKALDRSTSVTLSQNTLGSIGISNELKGTGDLSLLIMSMRKLREGIVASKRIDDFSTQAYLFCIRLCILAKHKESYHPALLHLLRKMHTVRPLSNVELQEFAGYLVLHLACQQQDLAGAYLARHQYNLRDSKVNAALSAIAHDNYHLFWLVKRSVDGHKAKLMEYAEEGMKLQALKCLGRTYFTVDLAYLEKATNSSWSTLTKHHEVGWELQGKAVVIRKPKTR